MDSLAHFVRRIRPAPLGSLVAGALGLRRPRLVQTPDGTFTVSRVSHLGNALAEGGYEPQMCAVLHRYLRAGDTFVDLGANEGFFTVAAARLVGESGAVVAVEPQSRLLPVIHANLALNGCLNVRVVQAVISSATGQTSIHITPAINTGASALTRPTRYRLRTQPVESLSLSDFVRKARLSSCQLMKVDIEGAEYDVFTNAVGVLKSGVFRNIALEFHDAAIEKQGKSSSDLHAALLESGYRLNTELGVRVYEFADRQIL